MKEILIIFTTLGLLLSHNNADTSKVSSGTTTIIQQNDTIAKMLQRRV